MSSRPSRRLGRSLLIVLALSLAARAAAQSYDPPTNYYASATGTGATLKSQLNNIIDGHTVTSYDAARTILQVTDADPARPGYILLAYNRESLRLADIGGSIPGWDGSTWNREHTWPESRGVSGASRSDLFNLRPTRNQINSDRGNLNFGGAYGQTYGTKSDGGAVWYPGDVDAGMIARQEFYMDVRYDGVDSGGPNLTLLAGNPGGSNQLGNLNRLIEWHFAAPPDAFERRRNQLIYDNYQHNRNPFTDNPEMAWSVFVDQANDSQVAVAGATVGADGSSELLVDFGRRIVGTALPAVQNVTLNKAGLDGTYFRVTASGAATSSLSGKFNAFRTNQTDSKSLAVGLSGSTSAAGLMTGTVTIDNLDITTGGGAGRGANDGNDVITSQLALVDHANGSFAAGSVLDSLTIDLGTVTQGAQPATAAFSLYNVESTLGFTAGLELDGIQASGDTGALLTDLSVFGGESLLPGGASRQFTATLDTSAAGMFSASYQLMLSDENLVGATSGMLMTLNLTGVVTPTTSGDDADFDGNGLVDGADLLAWQAQLGLHGAERTDGDANGDGIVDGADLAIWINQFPPTGAGEATSVASPIPEPPTSTLLPVLGSAGLLASPNWRRLAPGRAH